MGVGAPEDKFVEETLPLAIVMSHPEEADGRALEDDTEEVNDPEADARRYHGF